MSVECLRAMALGCLPVKLKDVKIHCSGKKEGGKGETHRERVNDI